MTGDRRQNADSGLDRWLNPAGPARDSSAGLPARGFLDPVTAARNLTVLAQGPSGDRWRSHHRELDRALCASPDPDLALAQLLRLPPCSDLFPLIGGPAALDRLLGLLGASPFLGDLLTTRPERIGWLFTEGGADRRADEAVLSPATDPTEADGRTGDPLLVLNSYKRTQLLRIGARAVFGLSDLEEEFTALTRLAELILAAVLDRCWPDDLLRPAVIAVGKFGGGELNFSSDLDLIFLLPGQAADTLARTLPPSTRAVEKTVEFLTAYTREGSLYRIDLRLRPGGDRAPLIRSAGRLLSHYADQGAPWERQMLVKARICAGDRALGHTFLTELEPFIYPHHAARDPREEAHRLRRERRAREGGGADPRHVKLAPGGIRDVEFVVQVLQLLFGGRHPAVRPTGTLAAIAALEGAGILPAADATRLAEAYTFSRRLEHLIQMQEDRQEFTLPTAPARLRAIARLAGVPDGEALLTLWDKHRDAVRSSLQALLPGSGEDESGEPVESLLTLPPGGEEAVGRLARRGFQRPAQSHRVLLATAAEVRASGAGAQAAFIGLLPPLLQDARATGDPDRSLNNLERVLRRLGSPGAYARLLAREPAVRRALLRLCASGDLLADLLTRHPEHFERLFSRGAAGTAASPSAWRQRLLLARHRARSSRELAAELESVRTREFLASGLAYVSGECDLTGLMNRLGALARDLVRCFIGHHFREAVAPPRFCTLSLGTLSAGSMTFASDADLLFIHAEGAGATVQTLAAQVAGLLSPPGGPYPVDMRLRPEGRSAPTSVDVSYLNTYLRDRASPWEALALSRHRPLYGRRRLLGATATVIESWLAGFRLDPDTVRDLRAVRHRLESAVEYDPAAFFDVKRSPGAMADIEYLALALALETGIAAPSRPVHLPELMPHLVSAGRLPKPEGRLLADAYLHLRRIQVGLQLHYGRDITAFPSAWPDELTPVPLRAISWDRTCREAARVREIYERIFPAGA